MSYIIGERLLCTNLTSHYAFRFTNGWMKNHKKRKKKITSPFVFLEDIGYWIANGPTQLPKYCNNDNEWLKDAI